MVGFRNILVHDYRELGLDSMKDVIEHRPDDLIRFANDVLAHLGNRE